MYFLEMLIKSPKGGRMYPVKKFRENPSLMRNETVQFWGTTDILEYMHFIPMEARLLWAMSILIKKGMFGGMINKTDSTKCST